MLVLKIVVTILAMVSVAAVVAMFTKDQYTLKREIVINMPKGHVFDFIKLNQNQTLYSKWLRLDPDTKIKLSGAQDGTPGAILAFESKNSKVGRGEWEIKRVQQDERVEFELRFLEPFEFVANGYFATEVLSPHQTRVMWVYNSGMKWPMNFLLLFLDMDKLVGNDIQSSLVSMKAELETP